MSKELRAPRAGRLMEEAVMRWQRFRPDRDSDNGHAHVECTFCSEDATRTRGGFDYCDRHYLQVHPQRIRRLLAWTFGRSAAPAAVHDVANRTVPGFSAAGFDGRPEAVPPVSAYGGERDRAARRPRDGQDRRTRRSRSHDQHRPGRRSRAIGRDHSSRNGSTA